MIRTSNMQNNATMNENKPQQENKINVEIIYNEDKNGIELKFDDKPNEETRTAMKNNGFRWAKFNKVWYAKDNQEVRKFLNEYFGTSSEGEKVEINQEESQEKISYPEIDINDIETYTISSELSKRENDGHWVMRVNERNHQQEIQNTLQNMNNELMELLKNTDDVKIIYNAKKWLQSYKKRYYEWYTKKLTQDANNPSWMTTGRDGRNRNKDAKYSSAHDKLMAQYCYGLEPEYKDKIASIKNQFRKEKQQNYFNDLMAITEFVEVKRVKRLVNSVAINQINVFENTNTEAITYNYGEYDIVKTWGSWHIFKNGIMLDCEGASNLDIAKRILTYQIQKTA